MPSTFCNWCEYDCFWYCVQRCFFAGSHLFCSMLRTSYPSRDLWTLKKTFKSVVPTFRILRVFPLISKENFRQRHSLHFTTHHWQGIMFSFTFDISSHSLLLAHIFWKCLFSRSFKMLHMWWLRKTLKGVGTCCSDLLIPLSRTRFCKYMSCRISVPAAIFCSRKSVATRNWCK